MKAAIVALGTATPAYKRSQAELTDLVSAGCFLNPVEKRLLKSMYRATGIQARYSVLSDYDRAAGEFEFFPNDPESPYPSTAARMAIYKANALNLSLAAIENCLAKLPSFDKAELTHLITVSCTGMYAPGIDIELVEQLKLSSSTKRTTINFMGCYGAFNALKVADSICRAEPRAKVLVVCVELCTIHFQKSMSLDNMIANAIFADGAAAALIQAEPQDQKHFKLETFYCDILPQTEKEMAWQIGDSGFDIVLSSYVPEAIHSGIAAFIERLLAQSPFKRADLDYFAIHPGGLKILQACEQALGLKKEDNKHAYKVLADYGNMSSATILFVLHEIWSAFNESEHDKNIFCCAFGPGLTLESMILKVNCQ